MNQPNSQNVSEVDQWEVTMSGSTFTVRLLGAAVATLMLVSACGSSPVTPGAAPTNTKASTSGGLSVATTSLGPVLVDGRGHTVYLLTADTPGHSSCSAQCLQFWPAVPVPAGSDGPSAVPSVQGVSAALSVTKATNGASILTAGGWPLYTFVNDQAPGDVMGQGVNTFGGTWYAVSPSGEAVTAPPSVPPATSGTPRGGYGY